MSEKKCVTHATEKQKKNTCAPHFRGHIPFEGKVTDANTRYFRTIDSSTFRPAGRPSWTEKWLQALWPHFVQIRLQYGNRVLLAHSTLQTNKQHAYRSQAAVLHLLRVFTKCVLRNNAANCHDYTASAINEYDQLQFPGVGESTAVPLRRLGSNAGLRGESFDHGTAQDSSNRRQKKVLSVLNRRISKKCDSAKTGNGARARARVCVCVRACACVCVRARARARAWMRVLGPIHIMRPVTVPSEWSVFTLSVVFSHLPEQQVIGGLRLFPSNMLPRSFSKRQQQQH